MIKKIIKDFLTPTKVKIVLTILIFIGTIFLIANRFPSDKEIEKFSLYEKTFYFFSIPDLYIQQICLYKTEYLCSLHKTVAFTLFYTGDAQSIRELPIQNLQSLEILSGLFFLLPIRIIYYYILSCGAISILFKIKKEK